MQGWIAAKRQSRFVKHCNSALKAARSNQEATARFVNKRFAGRVGELLSSGDAKIPGASPNAMLVIEMIRIAMKRAVAGTSRKALKTKRAVDCVAAVALTYGHAVQENLRLLHLAAETRSEPIMHLWLTRHWDETPVRVQFGTAAHLLRPCARYWQRELQNDKRIWRLFFFHDEFIAGKGNNMAAGTLNFFASRCKLAWTTVV